MTIRPHDPVARELFDQMATWPIYDPHSHIDPRRPAARHLDEILGYHYYTELAHSAGMPANLVAAELTPDERVANLAAWLGRIDNTVQYSWLTEIASTFHGFDGPITPATVGKLAAKADKQQAGPAWDESVWKTSNLETIFLTNDFDDPLTGWDRTKFVPCLRTDDLVLKLELPRTLDRIRTATDIQVEDLASLHSAIGVLFDRFVKAGAKACAISLPPDFIPFRSNPKLAVTPIRRALSGLDLRSDEHQEIRRTVFWMIAEFCADYQLPFDLMIGPIRDIYPAGVAGGRDLFDRRVSLRDYRDVFNHFSGVTFPISTLSPDAGAELVAYSWIFPNVVPMGHWWYSNIPTFIRADLEARLTAVPKTKQVGYYSDAYKLEFVLPKFNTYRKALAEVLADCAIRGQAWSVERALEVARLILIDNPKRIFARSDEH